MKARQLGLGEIQIVGVPSKPGVNNGPAEGYREFPCGVCIPETAEFAWSDRDSHGKTLGATIQNQARFAWQIFQKLYLGELREKWKRL